MVHRVGSARASNSPQPAASQLYHTRRSRPVTSHLHLSGPPASPCSFCPLSKLHLEPESPHSASYLVWGPLCVPILIALLPPNPNLLAMSHQQIVPLAHQELTAE